jgi:hypothetical protein
MSVRPFGGIRALSGAAEPVFGTVLTAAVTPQPDPFAGNNGPGTNQTQVEVTVSSTAGFTTGLQVAIGPGSAFKPGLSTSTADVGTIKQIVSATVLLVQGLEQAHASGEFCILNEIVGNVHIIPVVTTTATYIGNGSTVAAGDASVFDILPITASGAGPTYFHDSESIGGAQPMTTTEYWIIGTAGDTFLSRFTQV